MKKLTILKSCLTLSLRAIAWQSRTIHDHFAHRRSIVCDCFVPRNDKFLFVFKPLLIFPLLLISLSSSFSSQPTLKGVWEFQGGIYNGKQEGATIGYTLQRRYDKKHFEAFGIEAGSKPEKYQAGDYELRGGTCIETETYSSQPSKLTGVPVRYLYSIRNDTLTLKATLPSGMTVEEYWKRAK